MRGKLGSDAEQQIVKEGKPVKTINNQNKVGKFYTLFRPAKELIRSELSALKERTATAKGQHVSKSILTLAHGYGNELTRSNRTAKSEIRHILRYKVFAPGKSWKYLGTFKYYVSRLRG